MYLWHIFLLVVFNFILLSTHVHLFAEHWVNHWWHWLHSYIFSVLFLNRLCSYCTICTYFLQHSHAGAPDTFLLKIKSIPDEIGCVLSLMERIIPMNISHADSISIFDCLVDSADLQCIWCHLWDERFWTICKHGEVLGEMRNRAVRFSRSILRRCC